VLSPALIYKDSADNEITGRSYEDLSKVEEKTKLSVTVTFRLREEKAKILYISISNTITLMISIY
jgi:hypothetical protein